MKLETEYPMRTCKSMHSCCYGKCSYPAQTIQMGQRYYDGGHGRRMHEACGRKAEAITIEAMHAYDVEQGNVTEAEATPQAESAREEQAILLRQVAPRMAVVRYVISVCAAAGVRTHVFGNGAFGLMDAPSKWASVVDAMAAGLECAMAGEPLPPVVPPASARVRR